MTHGSLFSGVGGFDLAAEYIGWDNIFHCEIDNYCRKLLKHYWPNAKSYGDIQAADFSIFRGRTDVLTGGWPCQDNSKAKQHGGGQMGLMGERSGLFTSFDKTISIVKPRWVVGENVPDILTINRGEDFRFILESFYGNGYTVTWKCLRGSDFGSPDHRKRLYLVANSGSFGLQEIQTFWFNVGTPVEKRYRNIAGAALEIGGAWENESPFPGVDSGIPFELAQIRTMGNVVKPPVAYQIFKAIEQYEKL